MIDPRYPVGRFERPSAPLDAAARDPLVDQIEMAPARLRLAIAGLSAAQLDHPYRDGGWTVRQVVHHVPDSHMNAYVRCKLAVTEEDPTIKTYDEAAWARLPEAEHGEVEVSLTLLDALHRRWVAFLRGLDESQWQRTLRHPEMGLLRLDATVALYAWHGRHHVAHVTGLRERMGW